MEIGETIRKYRKSKQLTQTELGAAVGVSKGTVINWENGRTFPSYCVAKQLADFFNIDVSELRYNSTDIQDGAKKDAAGFLQANKLANQLIGLFAGGKLSESDKEAVMLTLQSAYIACKTENAEIYGKKGESIDDD